MKQYGFRNKILIFPNYFVQDVIYQFKSKLNADPWIHVFCVDRIYDIVSWIYGTRNPASYT